MPLMEQFEGFESETVEKSSNVIGFGYKEDCETLRVMFNSGICYDYPKVPIAIYNQLQHANTVLEISVGKGVRQWVQTISKGVKVPPCLGD